MRVRVVAALVMAVATGAAPGVARAQFAGGDGGGYGGPGYGRDHGGDWVRRGEERARDGYERFEPRGEGPGYRARVGYGYGPGIGYGPGYGVRAFAPPYGVVVARPVVVPGVILPPPVLYATPVVVPEAVPVVRPAVRRVVHRVAHRAVASCPCVCALPAAGLAGLPAGDGLAGGQAAVGRL